MKQEEVERLRNYYDQTDLSANIDNGQLDTDVDPNPMVTTSLRLPKDVLDWVREQAAAQHVRPTTLLRQWVEERRSNTANLESRLARLEQAVFDKASH
ncbi:BrnA antitoxin family protein [Pseudonocardia sp. McavD-2-B]|uniref:BrnA antitoxin family protein n=1 Tax=Pseudonocardia sp. McavD-2-B TaxID=2954499 RepID=UPI0020977DAF|nr:BrnA antitoxin family protein [Pseudonocardia sp. McavD-2-B]MCO7196265.1 BrnA antitoxin family protein [Pseudonocardia sp. McavD-2-B]